MAGSSTISRKPPRSRLNAAYHGVSVTIMYRHVVRHVRKECQSAVQAEYYGAKIACCAVLCCAAPGLPILYRHPLVIPETLIRYRGIS